MNQLCPFLILQEKSNQTSNINQETTPTHPTLFTIYFKNMRVGVDSSSVKTRNIKKINVTALYTPDVGSNFFKRKKGTGKWSKVKGGGVNGSELSAQSATPWHYRQTQGLRVATLRNKKLLSTCNHLFYLIIIIKCYFTTQTKTKIQFRSFQS